MTGRAQPIRKGGDGGTIGVNVNALTDTTDIVVALDRLQAMVPAVKSVSLVVARFGNALRAGECQVQPARRCAGSRLSETDPRASHRRCIPAACGGCPFDGRRRHEGELRGRLVRVFGHQSSGGSGDALFHLEPLWADPQIDFVGIDNQMPLSDWRDGFAHADAQVAPAIYDRAYLPANIADGEGSDWDYAGAADRAAQVRTPITGGAGKPWVLLYKDLEAWWSNEHFDRSGGIEAASPTAWIPQSKPIRSTEFGCPAIDRGTNQPNVFFDPKSS